MTRRLRRLWARARQRRRELGCGLLGGHLRVTRSGGGHVYDACFVCDRRLSVGWRAAAGRDVRENRPRADGRRPRVVEQLADWHQKHGVAS